MPTKLVRFQTVVTWLGTEIIQKFSFYASKKKEDCKNGGIKSSRENVTDVQNIVIEICQKEFQIKENYTKPLIC